MGRLTPRNRNLRDDAPRLSSYLATRAEEVVRIASASLAIGHLVVRRERFRARGIYIPCLTVYSQFNGDPRSYLEFPNRLIVLEFLLVPPKDQRQADLMMTQWRLGRFGKCAHLTGAIWC